MILETILNLIIICHRAVLSVPRVPIQVDFLHWRNRIIPPADQQSPKSVPDQGQPALSVGHHHEPPHLLGEQVSQDVEVGDESETEQYLESPVASSVHTESRGLGLGLEVSTVEPGGQVDQETEDQDTRQQPVAPVAAAQLEVERHLEVLDVRHHA